MKNLPRTILFTLALLAASLFGGIKEVNAQGPDIGCNFYPTDSVVGVYNSENRIYIIPGATGNNVLNSLQLYSPTSVTIFNPDGVTPAVLADPLPNGARLHVEWLLVSKRATTSRDFVFYYRADLVSESYKLNVIKGQLYPGSIEGFIQGVTVKEILDTLVTNVGGQLKIFKDYGLTVEALPGDAVGYNFVLQVITPDLISKENYILQPFSELSPYFSAEPSCAGGINNNVIINYSGAYPFGAKFRWFANGNLVSSVDTSTAIHLVGGNYNLELKIFNSMGNQMGNQNQNVFVPGSTEWFEMSSGPEACPNVNVNFNYNGNSQGMEWDFGTGTFVQNNNNNNSNTFVAGLYTIRLKVDPGSNCPVDTITRPLTVKIGAKPYTVANSYIMEACRGDKMEFTAGGGWSSDYSYSWDVNGETTIKVNQFTYAFSTLGQKLLILTTSNSCGGIAKDTATVNIGANIPANAEFNFYQVGPGCTTKSYQFNAQGSGSYIWNFGFGKSSLLQRPIAEFGYSNQVKLMVSNGCGNSATSSKLLDFYATAGSGGNVNFSFKDYEKDTITIAPGDRLDFSNNSNLNEAVRYTWNFGDGITLEDNSQRVSHVYADTITVKTQFEVNLGVNKVCSTGVVSPKYVIVDPTVPLMADLRVLPTRVCPGDKVYFFDDNRRGLTYTYSIDYGDGTSVSGISNLESTALEILRSHKYTAPGSFTYIFTAHAGLVSRSVQGVITVTNNSSRVPYYYIENSTYRGEGQYFAEAMAVDSTHYLKFSDINEPMGDYEMGYHITAIDALHPYAQGRFIRKSGQISLVEGYGVCGQDASYNLTIYGTRDSLKLNVVTDACANRLAFLNGKILRFLASEGSEADLKSMYACPKDSVRFVLAGSLTQAWHLTGNSTVQSTLAEAFYNYPAIGNYLAYAVVGNSCGRIDTLYTKVVVSSANIPQSDFWMNIASPSAGDAIRFTYSGAEEGRGPVNAKLLWDFGDGITSTALSPVHRYDQPGAFKVRLQATNGCGTRVSERDVMILGEALNMPTAIAEDGSNSAYFKIAGKAYRLDGSASRSSSGSTQGLSFEWYPPAGVTMASLTTPMPSYVLPSSPNSLKFIFKLKVTDLVAKTSAWAFIEIVGAPALIADAGPDFEAMEGTMVSLNGSASSGSFLSAYWENLGYTINIANSNSLNASAMLPPVTKDSVAIFTLTLNGADGYSITDTLRITIKNLYAQFFVDPLTGNDTFSGTDAGQAFKTIARAASAIATDGIINLLPGTYLGPGNTQVDMLGKDVYVRSTGGAATTILQGSGTDTLFISIGGSRFCKVDGLTIKNFSLVADLIMQGSLQLVRNRFSNCSSVVIGGMGSGTSRLLANRNVFYECYYPFYYVQTDSLIVNSNSFYYSLNASGAVISNCFTGYADVNNNIVVGYLYGFDMTNIPNSRVEYNNIYNSWTPIQSATYEMGQTFLDPLYVDPAALNFALKPSSPCIDAGNPAIQFNDLDGSRADMGAVPTFRSAATQNIPLQRGWNVFSSNVLPLKPNMLDVLKPFVTSTQLIKVLDQAGNYIEFSYSGYWENMIGAIDYTKGYLAKFDSNVNLSISGAPIVKNIDIPVNSGWNIIGMPLTVSKNVVDVVRHIQQNDNMLKVQSQTGAALEFLAGYGWVNTIGMLKPGQGYRVRVEANEIIKFSAPPVTRSREQATTLRADQSNFFKPIWAGNGINHMNVYVSVDARLNLQPGDEVAVYSNGVCIGASAIYDPSVLLPILISQDDPTSEEVDGFTDGDMLSFKVYMHLAHSVSENYVITASGGLEVAAKRGGALVVSLSPNGTTGTEIITTITNSFGMYPNPSEGEVTLDFSNAVNGEVSLEVFNLLGEKVAVIVKRAYLPGQHTVTWNGQTDGGDRVAPGLYLVRFSVGGSSISKRIVMK